MAILQQCELWWARLEPSKPNTKFDAINPKWELQIRTTNKAVKKLWEELSLKVKAVIPEDDDSVPYYSTTLRRPTLKRTGEKMRPVEVVDGAGLPLDPGTIGNGSIGNVRIFQYEALNPKTQSMMIGTQLTGVQITRLVKYTPKPNAEAWIPTEMEIIDPSDLDTDESREEFDKSNISPMNDDLPF
jgi:hypothetical protein